MFWFCLPIGLQGVLNYLPQALDRLAGSRQSIVWYQEKYEEDELRLAGDIMNCKLVLSLIDREG